MAKKPSIQYFWSGTKDPVVNWRLIGANGEILCQSTQGFRDKADARRSVCTVGLALTGYHPTDDNVREVGPGRKPGTGAAK